jgi:hypothetical protein
VLRVSSLDEDEYMYTFSFAESRESQDHHD